MGARVFISHRRGAGIDAATALSQDLDALFGDGQVVRIDTGRLSGQRWREAIAPTSGNSPILLVLVTPDVPETGPAQPGDDPLREQIDAGLAAGAHLLPVLGDGAAEASPAEDLPAPFERLSRLPRRELRAAAWADDIARIAEDLRELGVRPLAGIRPGTMPLPIHGPTTAPMPLDEGGADPAPAGNDTVGRRGMLGMVTVALLLAGGWGAWRWQQRRAANLSGIWRTRIGLRDAPTSRDGSLMLATIEQRNRNLRLSSTVGIDNDPQWEVVRDAWKERTGSELKQVIYRGEGELIDEGESAKKPASAAADAASDGASAAARARRADPTLGMRRVVIAVRIVAPGASGEQIDEGLFRGVVDISDQRIHGRLWLESEQAERVVDLRRGD